MTGNEAALAVITALEANGVAYMVVGSLSSSAYGIARSTQDAGFVIQLEGTPLARIVESLGNGFMVDHQMSFETVTGTHRYLLHLPHSGFKIELFLLREDPYDQERFRRRVQTEALERIVWLPTPEDVIINKLRWSKLGKRTKDVEDVKNVMAVQGDGLDWAYIYRWCDEHGTRSLLDEVRSSIPREKPS